MDCCMQNMTYHFLLRKTVIILGILFFAKLTKSVCNRNFMPKFLWLSQFSVAIYFFHESTLTIYTKLLARILP
jgi:surface polysaccharide O-acyltransferase-like enzyme